MNDPSPSFESLSILVPAFGIVVVTLGLILVVFILDALPSFPSTSYPLSLFFSCPYPFKSCTYASSHTTNTLEAMYELEHTITFHLQDLAASRCLCLGF